MNWKWIAGAAFALFAAGYGAGTCGKATTEQVDAAHDSTAAAVALAHQADDARAAIALQANAKMRAQQATVDSALSVAHAARAARPQTEDRIVMREAPADTAAFRRGFQAGRDTTEATEIQPRDVAFKALSVKFNEQTRVLVATQAALEAEQGAGRRRDVEIAALRSARPSWFTRHGVPAIKLALVAAGAYEVGKATARQP